MVRRLSAEADKAEQVPGLIRVTQLKGQWILVPKGDQLTEVTYQLEAEPAGDIPSWLANQFVIDAPMVSLRTLRAVAERQGVREQHTDLGELKPHAPQATPPTPLPVP